MNDYNLTLNFTKHAIEKSGKRSISPLDIRTIINFGSVIHKQNKKFYYITSSNVPGGLELNTRITSIVIITSLDNKVITCYYNNRPQTHISKKQKRYSKIKHSKQLKNGFTRNETSLYQYGILNVA